MTGSSMPSIDSGDDLSMSDIERLVQRLAREECPDGVCPIEPVLQSCVHDAVTRLLTTSAITGYVPVLALKQVRDRVRAGTCEPRIAAE